MLSGIKRRSSDEKGVEVIEFVGLLPLVLIVALIIWQFMVFAHTRMAVANAAREGARRAAAYEWSSIGDAVRSTAGDGASWGYTWGPCSSRGQPVAVWVKAPLPIVDIPWVPIPPLEVRSTAIMFCEEPDY